MTAAADRFDPYAVLGVSPDADATDLRRAWRAQVRRFHPDTAGDVPDAAERLRAVHRAYAELAAPAHRDDAATLEPTRPIWVESPYPMPPRPRTGTTFLLALAFVALPAVALTLPGVPDRVARIWHGDDPGAAAFARARLDQVRRLISPSALAGPTPAAPAATPVPVVAIAPAIDPGTIAAAVRHVARMRWRHVDLAGATAACTARAARYAGWASHDYCTAFAIAAGRDDTAATLARYRTLGLDTADAAARAAAIASLVRRGG